MPRSAFQTKSGLAEIVPLRVDLFVLLFVPFRAALVVSFLLAATSVHAGDQKSDTPIWKKAAPGTAAYLADDGAVLIPLRFVIRPISIGTGLSMNIPKDARHSNPAYGQPLKLSSMTPRKILSGLLPKRSVTPSSKSKSLRDTL